MKKRTTAIIASIAIAASVFGASCDNGSTDGSLVSKTSARAGFSDTSGHWAEEYIEDLSGKGLVEGYPDGTFKPESPISREEAAQMISNYVGLVQTNSAVPADAQNRWSTPAIKNLIGQNIIEGYPDGTFRPESKITRAEFSTMAYKILNSKDKLDPSIERQFGDLSGHWAEKSVETLSGNGIIEGYSDGKFRPESNITRAEAATIVSLAMKEYMNSTVYYLKDNGTEMYLVHEVHRVEKTSGVARAALNELISGTPLTQGAFKVMPAGTRILGIDIENGLATVDFSKEVLGANVGASGEALGIASIVNTLTEFPTIQKVQFTVEGSAQNGMDWWGHVGLYDQPFERDLSEVYEPVIWVNSPVANQKISSPVAIKGNARIFEAVVNFRLRDSSGSILAEGYSMASAGAPDRGDFTGQLSFASPSPGKGQIEVFEVSMKDGSEINKVIIPVKW